jgi:hypothetical protein
MSQGDLFYDLKTFFSKLKENKETRLSPPSGRVKRDNVLRMKSDNVLRPESDNP